MEETYEGTYPSECPVCKQKTGSIKCMLPWAMIQNIMFRHKQMDLIELSIVHANYGIDYLIHNASFTAWSETGSCAPSIDLSRSEIGTPDRKQDTESQTNESEIAEHQPLNENEQPLAKSQEDVNVTETNPQTRKPAKVKPEANEETAKTVPEEKREAKIDKSQILSHPTQTSRLIVSNEQEDEIGSKTNNDQELIEHLASDLSIAIMVLFNSMQLKKKGATVVTFQEALLNELDTQKYHGDEYIFTNNSKLDHPIQMAKEMVSTHQDCQLDDWAEGTAIRQTVCCVLGFNKFKLEGKPNTRNFIDTLNEYANSALGSKTLSSKGQSHLIMLTRAQLQERDRIDAWTWFRTQNRKKTIESSKGKSAIISQKGITMTKKETEEHKCPSLPEDVEKFLKKEISVIIRQVIKDERKTLPQTKRDGDLAFELTRLGFEVIRHNTNWKDSSTKLTQDKFNEIDEHLRISERKFKFKDVESSMNKFLELTRKKYFSRKGNPTTLGEHGLTK
jgi:hypothetical protein